MDPRVSLLREYYRGLPTDRAKLETLEHGFEYLERLQARGVTLDYGELTLSGLLHKYKVSRVSDARMDAFLADHVAGRMNVCLYFHDHANSLFCFNLDNNHKVNNTEIIPEMATAISEVRRTLNALGCRPLVLASGRGFHVWMRLTGPVANDRLYVFMRRIAVMALARLHQEGRDHRKVKFNVYPDPRTRDTVSLRLFGSIHMKNRVFSRVATDDGLLDERASWKEFEAHLREKTLETAAFEAAAAAAMEPEFLRQQGFE